MGTLIADVRQALRLMRHSPTFTIVAIAALALGIGANTAIFSVVDRVLVRPLPYPDPANLVRLGRQYPDGVGFSNSIPKYMAWRQNNVFSAMALYDQQGPGLNLVTGDRPEQVKGAHISADYFKVFGVEPALGRTFNAIEDAPNGPRAAILSYGLWASRFGKDPVILSRRILLNGDAYTVVGVMPASFVGNPPAEVWIPLQADPNSTNQGHYLAAAARLRPGVTIERARAEMKLAGEVFRRQHPEWMDKNESVAVLPMQDSLVRDVKPALLILLGAVGFVLLIACANVANLLLARASTRARELAIRAAIGASRWRVVRQLLTESVILSAMGGAAGFVLGGWGVQALLSIVPGNIPLLTEKGETQHALSILDWRIGLFTLAVAFATGILFGLFPALHISRQDVASTLKEASGRSSTSRHQNLAKKILVGSEMALALVLLTGAVLLIRTVIGLAQVNAGIDPHHVLTLQTSLAGERYASTAKVDAFATQALRKIENLPGIEAASVSLALPTETEIDLPFNIAGKTPKKGDRYMGDEQWRFVSPGYFATFRIPLLRGRLFTERDLANSSPVVLINASMAKKYWKNENPVGQILMIGAGLGPQFADRPRQIIGIVGNVRETNVAESDVGVMYVPHSQVSDALTQLANSVLPLNWAVRSPLDASSLKTAIQRQIQSIDGQMPVANVRPMEEVISSEMARQNFNMTLLTVFAAIALVLASIGIYGLMSYSVEQQTQELGIRMALGADRRDLLRLVLKQGMTPTGIGIAVGLAIAFGVTRLLGSLLYGVHANDPVTFAAVAAVLACVAFASICVPARRAARLDPMAALREE